MVAVQAAERTAGAMVAERVLCAHPTLKADQREMVRRLLAEREGVSVVIGEAGTGKSYAILAAAQGWAEAGMEPRACATTWRAANVLRAEGLRATGVASLLAELERAEAAGERALASRSVLLADEGDGGRVAEESFAAGEGAVTVAKQNAEVEHLNAMARQLRREAEQLGEQGAETGKARFAAGDLIVTRVNDRSAGIYNRERWQVAP